MTINWNLYEKRLKMNGNTLRDRQINNLKIAMNNDFDSNPSYRSVYFNGSTVTTDVWVIDSIYYNIKTILSRPDEIFYKGDIVAWNGLTYLIIDIDKDNSVQTKGQIELCNNTLSILKDNILHHVPCIIESNVRFQDLRVQETRFIVTPDDKITARIPNNEITKDISRNLIFKLNDYDNYKITSVNRVTEPGLIILKMEYSIENSEEHNFTVNILNGSSINVHHNSTLKLNVNVYDNGVLLPSELPIVYSSSNNQICTVDNTGLITAVGLGRCDITASINGVSDTINVLVIEAFVNNYTYSLYSNSLPDTEIKINQTKTYTARKYNNGVGITGTFTFNVVGDTSAYEFKIIDGNNCTLKALKSGVSITLRAFENLNNTNKITKDISLKSLF